MIRLDGILCPWLLSLPFITRERERKLLPKSNVHCSVPSVNMFPNDSFGLYHELNNEFRREN